MTEEGVKEDGEEITPEDELRGRWNRVVETLIDLRGQWVEYQEFQLEHGRNLADRVSPIIAKLNSMFAKARFLDAVPGLLIYCKRYVGDLESLLIKKEEEE